MDYTTLFSSTLTPASQQSCDELASFGCFDTERAIELGVDLNLMKIRANIVFNWGEYLPEGEEDLVSDEVNDATREALFELWAAWLGANHPTQSLEHIDMALGCC